MTGSMLSVFVPTFLFVSITPGMCMTLALTLGMQIGFRRSLWMMAGELVGVGIVAGLSVLGVAALMLKYPEAFIVLKVVGGGYLAYLGYQLWRDRGKLALSIDQNRPKLSAYALASQGFVTAIANPKGWAFFIALLPPFIDSDQPLAQQLTLLIAAILLIEWLCLMIYSLGGKALYRMLQREGSVTLINRIAGTLMLGVAAWLVVS